MEKEEFTVLTASSGETLSQKINEYLLQGWNTVGSHQVVLSHMQNRIAGSQHMDSLYRSEYSISMRRVILK